MDTDLRGPVSVGVRMAAPALSGCLIGHNAPPLLGLLHKHTQNTNEHKKLHSKLCVGPSLLRDILTTTYSVVFLENDHVEWKGKAIEIGSTLSSAESDKDSTCSA